jgi:hypothetical protein
MKKETTNKKAWTKPDIQDLDVQSTASGTVYDPAESGITGTTGPDGTRVPSAS